MYLCSTVYVYAVRTCRLSSVGGTAQLRSICCLATNSSLAPLVLLRDDGYLGILILCPEDMQAANQASASFVHRDKLDAKEQTTHNPQKPTVGDAEGEDATSKQMHGRLR